MRHAFSPRVWLHLLVLRPLLRLAFGLTVEGREHVAGLGQLVLVSNHNSHLDILLLYAILPARMLLRVHPVAARDYFGRRPWLFHTLSWLFRPVWIERGAPAGDALAAMDRVLAEGRSLILFPEGTRGEPGQLGPFRSGIGRLLVDFPEVPAVPVLLSGPERALPRAARFPVPFWNLVVVGPPHRFSGSARDITDRLESMTRALAGSEAARRHRRTPRPAEPVTVAVLGIDGSGKSTVSRELARRLSERARVCWIGDTLVFFEAGQAGGVQPFVAELLRRHLARQAKAAKSLSGYKIPKLADLLLRDFLSGELRRWYSPEAIVLDGSPLLNLLAWARLYKGEAFDATACAAAVRVLTGAAVDPGAAAVMRRFPELEMLRRLGLTRFALPAFALLLDVPPEVSMRRIANRGEHRQIHETEESLGRLRESYLSVCEIVRRDFGVPVRIIDGTQGIEALIRCAIEEIVVRPRPPEDESARAR